MEKKNQKREKKKTKRKKIQKKIKKVKTKSKDRPTILADLSGPKIRVDAIEKDICVNKGDTVFVSNDGKTKGNIIPITKGFQFGSIHQNAKILINDGRIQLSVMQKISEGTLECQVILGGNIQSRKGVNFPRVELDVPTLSEQDKCDLDLAIKEGADWIALSFVRSASDADIIQSYLSDKNVEIPVMAKIEKWEAVIDIDSIIQQFDAVMVARGDLGAEVPLEKVPAIQKMVIKKAKRLGKPVVIATQILESMVESSVPTRAEVSDIANAIIDGTDGLLVTGETAAGANPEAVIDVLKTVIEETENTLSFDIFDYEPRQKWFSIAHAISHAACRVSKEVSAKHLVTMTHSGSTARMISRYRPEANLIALTPNKKCFRQLQIVWGVTPLLIKKYKNADQVQGIVKQALEENNLAENNEKIVITGGVPVGISGTTNYLSVLKI